METKKNFFQNLLSMFTTVLEDPDKLKRAAVLVIGIVWPIAAPWVAAKFGIVLTDTQLIAAIVTGGGVIATYLKQSGDHSALVNAAIITAQGGVLTQDDADKVITLPKATTPILLALLLGSALFGATPSYAQAPTASDLVHLGKGDAAPFEGKLYSLDLHFATAKRIIALESEILTRRDLDLHSVPAWLPWVGLAVGAVVAGVTTWAIVSPHVATK